MRDSEFRDPGSGFKHVGALQFGIQVFAQTRCRFTLPLQRVDHHDLYYGHYHRHAPSKDMEC